MSIGVSRNFGGWEHPILGSGVQIRRVRPLNSKLQPRFTSNEQNEMLKLVFYKKAG